MNIIIELGQGIIKRSTTAGKENTGSIAFMGGSYYIRNLETKYKDGTYNNIRMEANFNSQYGTNPSSILEATPSK
jgi:hypothetical protein